MQVQEQAGLQQVVDVKQAVATPAAAEVIAQQSRSRVRRIAMGTLRALTALTTVTLFTVAVAGVVYKVNRVIEDAKDTREAEDLLQKREAKAAMLNVPKPPLTFAELKNKNLMKVLGEDIRVGQHVLRFYECKNPKECAENEDGEIRFSVTSPGPSAGDEPEKICYRLGADYRGTLTKKMPVRVIQKPDGSYALEANFSVLGKVQVAEADIVEMIDAHATDRTVRRKEVIRKENEKLLLAALVGGAPLAAKTFKPDKTFTLGMPYDYTNPLKSGWERHKAHFDVEVHDEKEDGAEVVSAR
jgi:hypothetical protein